MSCRASSGALSSACFTAGGVELSEVEALADFDADVLHLRDERLIGDVGRVHLQQLRRVGEVFRRRHSIHLNLRQRLHIHTRVDLHRR
jgi:hypothetical protein